MKRAVPEVCPCLLRGGGGMGFLGLAKLFGALVVVDARARRMAPVLSFFEIEH